jgi:hypothetical protein
MVKMRGELLGELGLSSYMAGLVAVFAMNRISASGSAPLFALVLERDSSFDEPQQIQNPLVISRAAIEEELSCSAEFRNTPTALHEFLDRAVTRNRSDTSIVDPC